MTNSRQIYFFKLNTKTYKFKVDIFFKLNTKTYKFKTDIFFKITISKQINFIKFNYF